MVARVPGALTLAVVAAACATSPSQSPGPYPFPSPERLDRLVGGAFEEQVPGPTTAPSVELERLERDGPAVLAEGAVDGAADDVAVTLAHGALGVVSCPLDDAVEPPRFLARCPLETAAREARVEVAVRPTGDPRWRSALVRDLDPSTGPTTGAAEVAPADDPTARPDPSTAFEREWGVSGFPRPADAVRAELDALRRAAGRTPLGKDPEADAEAARLAAAWRAAPEGSARADRLARGLLAGWTLDRPIREGHLLVVEDQADPRAAARALLERPHDRAALLDPDATHLVVASVPSPAGATVVATVFSTFPDTVDEALRAKVEATVQSGIDDRPIRPFETALAQGAQRAADAVQGGEAPERALRDALDHASRELNAAVTGFYLTASDLDRLPTPRNRGFQTRPGVGLAMHRLEGSPWGEWVVFVLGRSTWEQLTRSQPLRSYDGLTGPAWSPAAPRLVRRWDPCRTVWTNDGVELDAPERWPKRTPVQQHRQARVCPRGGYLTRGRSGAQSSP